MSIPPEYSIKNSDGSFKKDFKMDLDEYIELTQFTSKEEVECYNEWLRSEINKDINIANLINTTPTTSNSIRPRTWFEGL